MEENKIKFDWKAIAIIVLAVVVIVCLSKIDGLNNRIGNLQGEISGLRNQITSQSNNINSIYNNVDEMLKKEASILSDVNYSLGELDTETHTIPVTVRVVPKNLTEDMLLSVDIDGDIVEFERNGNEFSATFPVNMFIAYNDFPMLNIKTGNETKTELLESVPLTALYTRYLPNVYTYIPPFDDYENGKLEIDAHLQFDVKPASAESDVTITNVELVTTKNDKEISRTDVTDKILHKEGVDTVEPHYTVRASYEAKYGDEIRIIVIAKDSLGYTHKIPAYYWHQIDENTSEAVTAIDNNTEIYDANGVLLTKTY
ncbi:MAG: hypothetical protein E7473_12285 [Ruminococcaceae bacterium]|nr:hypothetical protein [Oscillospiraceae bacterium]